MGIPYSNIYADEEVFTSSDPNFWDYVRLEDFTKNTGIESRDCHAFALKELLDNHADYAEKYSKDISITVSIVLADDICFISVKSPNPNSKQQIFTNLQETFNYKRAFSTKSNQFRVTRGAQGDALKKLGTLPYALANSNGSSVGKEDKQWEEPLVIQHNNKIDEILFIIDRKHEAVELKFAQTSCESTDTEIRLALPAPSKNNFARLINYFKEYVLFNTHISYNLYVNHELVFELSALNHVVKAPGVCKKCGYVLSNNPNSIYCYSEIDFNDFLNDIYNKKQSVYDVIRKSGFREVHQHDGRFDKWKEITLEQLSFAKSRKLHESLRNSMLPMSHLTPPYDTTSKTSSTRKCALLSRYLHIKSGHIEVDSDRAVYCRTKDAIYKDYENKIQFPFLFEVLAIPIKSGSDESVVISGVNYSTSITHRQYFEGQYTNSYMWTYSKTNKELEASNIQEIIRKAAAGENISDEASIPVSKQKVPCVLIAHLVAPRLNYVGYGKSSLVLEPFASDIAETIEQAVRKLPLKSRYIPSKDKPPSTTSCLRILLKKRWDDVRSNPRILDHKSPDYDTWTQSTVWYHLREEYLLPLEKEYGITIVKENTRDDMTSEISQICEQLEGHPSREDLGIFASPRATMYFKGIWQNVDIAQISLLAGKGTDVIFIEKRGALEIVKYISDEYGIAFVNTQGHFAEYPKDLITEIVNQGGGVAILTDFDCSGIHIAEKVVAEDIETEHKEHLQKISSDELIERLPFAIETKDLDTAPAEHLQANEEYISKHLHNLQDLIRHDYSNRVVRIGIDLDTIEYFVKQEIKENGIEDEVHDTELFKRRLEELKKEVEEPYPKPTDPKKQQPGKNVVTPIIQYARNYDSYLKDPSNPKFAKYKRYKYIYENLEYLTGINPSNIYKDDLEPTEGAMRIEIDSVIKVVKASRFAQFILDKLQEHFPDRNYNRAIEPETEFYTDRLNHLPPNIKKLLLYVKRVADEATVQVEKEIESELKQIKGMLYLPLEEAEIEKRVSEAIWNNPELQALDEKVGKFIEEGGYG